MDSTTNSFNDDIDFCEVSSVENDFKITKSFRVVSKLIELGIIDIKDVGEFIKLVEQISFVV